MYIYFCGSNKLYRQLIIIGAAQHSITLSDLLSVSSNRCRNLMPFYKKNPFMRLSRIEVKEKPHIEKYHFPITLCHVHIVFSNSAAL